jgi:hypothetical protein
VGVGGPFGEEDVAGEGGVVGGVDGVAVEVGAAAAGGGEDLVSPGVGDDAEEGFAVWGGEAEGDGAPAEAVGVVGGAVDGVDEPVWGAGGAFVDAVFLAFDAVGGELAA